MPCDDFVIDGYSPATNEIIILYIMERAGGRAYPPPYQANRGLGRPVEALEAFEQFLLGARDAAPDAI